MTDKLSIEWVKKNGEKLKKAFNFAVDNKYDIRSVNDVIEVLKIVDPDNANAEHAVIFSKMLQLFSFKLKKTVTRRQKVN